MIWDKKKMKNGIQQIPIGLFDKENICPICNKKVIPENEKFNKTKAIPYIRYFNKFYFVHKECFYILYEGMNSTIKDNIQEYSAYTL